MSMSEQNANIQFVKEIEKYPTLYNCELPSYTRKDMSDEAWENVGRTMNMTPSACRERWRNLRAVFMRTMKAPPRSSGKKKPYYLSEVMQFVVPFMRPVRAVAGVQKKLVKDHEETQQPAVIEQFKIEVPDDESYDSSEQSAEEEREKEILVTRKRPVQDEESHQPTKLAKIALPALSSMPPNSDHVRSFLDSLLPELTEMNSAQFKNFKRRVLVLIDDIVTEIPATPRRPTDDEYFM